MNRLLVLLCACCVAGVSHAGVIYDNGVPTSIGGGPISDLGYSVGQQAADEFALPVGENVITDIHWWGFYYNSTGPAVDDFTIQVYSNVAGKPAASADVLDLNIGNVGRTYTGIDTYGKKIFAYSANIAPLALSAGTTYWLAIMDDTGGTFGSDYWHWARQTYSAGVYAARTALPTVAWNTGTGILAFNLTDDNYIVPEPAACWLMLVGIAALYAARRRAS